MEGWTRRKDEQKTCSVQECIIEEETLKDLEVIEEEQRRMDNKRVADNIVEEDRPKKKRKVKYKRLEDWGESKEQEQDTDTITTIQDYVNTEVGVTRAEQGRSRSMTPQGPELIDLETNTLLCKSKKLQERKRPSAQR